MLSSSKVISSLFQDVVWKTIFQNISDVPPFTSMSTTLNGHFEYSNDLIKETYSKYCLIFEYATQKNRTIIRYSSWNQCSDILKSTKKKLKHFGLEHCPLGGVISSAYIKKISKELTKMHDVFKIRLEGCYTIAADSKHFGNIFLDSNENKDTAALMDSEKWTNISFTTIEHMENCSNFCKPLMASYELDNGKIELITFQKMFQRICTISNICFVVFFVIIVLLVAYNCRETTK